MKKSSRKTLLRLLETIADILALAFGLQLLADIIADKECSDTGLYLTIFLFNTIAYLLSAFNTRNKKKIVFIKYLVIGISYFAISVMLIVIPTSSNVITYTFCVYILTVIFTRVMATIKNHRVYNIVWNSIVILLWALLLLGPFSEEWTDYYSSVILGISIPIQMIVRVTVLSFSHFRYDILVNVVKKSMAIEILSGLMILIVSFSFVLQVVEPDMENYFDALWYCFAIVTTIGFGDIVATNMLGRILSVILGLYGLVVVALITSIIVNFYSEVNKNTETVDKPDKADNVIKSTDRESTDGENTSDQA